MKNGDTTELRQRAEAALANKRYGIEVPAIATGDLIRELQIHQLELEAQNESLRQMQHELTAARERYFELYDLAPVGYVTLDEGARLIEVNRSAAELLGATRSVLLGQALSRFILPDCAPAFELHRRAVFDSRERQSCELQILDPAGAIHHLHVESVRSPRGEWHAALLDVTEKRRLEHELRETQKLEAVGTLASGVAHEFNNRLMAIVGCAEIALQHMEQDGTARTSVEQVRQAALRGREVTAQLLSFARPDEDTGSAELDAAVSGAVPLLHQVLGSGVALELGLNAGLERVPLGPGVIEQVLLTLAANARDAMPQGGTLRITTSCAVVAGSTSASPGGQDVTLAVRDNGAGMDTRVVARAFEPFFTTKPAGVGFGLGLSLVYGIVKRAQGRVAIESELGAGTAVLIHLPRAERLSVPPPCAGNGAESRAPASGATTALDGLEVLLVEDEALIRFTLRRYLEGWGCVVHEASDGEQAFENLRARPAIGLMISDVVLDSNALGLQIAGRARELHGNGMRAFYVSAHPRRLLLQRGWIEPDAIVLEKPFTREELELAVLDALRD